MSIYRGAIYLLSKGAWVNENEMSRGFLAFPRTEFLGLHAALVAVAAVVAAALRDRRCAARAWRAISTRPAGTRGGKLLRHRCGAHAVHQRTRSAAPSPASAAICGWRVSRWRTPTSRWASEALGNCRLPHLAAWRLPAASVRQLAWCWAACSIGIIRSEPAARGHSRALLADVHQWRGHPGGRAAERAAARVQAHHPRTRA